MKQKYYRIYITKDDAKTVEEIARFTSKGLMFVCIEPIRELYANSEYVVVYDRTY